MRNRSTALGLSLSMIALAVLGSVGADRNVATLDGFPEGSYLLDDGSIAVPLRRDTPSSFTEEIRDRVMRAGEKGLAYSPELGRELAIATNFLFIRPGAWMWAPSWCTMNFVYGTAGAYQLGSAGHCNPVVGTPVIVRIATPTTGILYAWIGNTTAAVSGGVGNDWSLTTIRSVWQGHVDPNVAGIWGPQGGAWTGTATLTSAKAVKHFGHGTGIGTGGTPRAGIMNVAFPGQTSFYFTSPSMLGDSGSPVLLAGDTANPLGQAVGILTHLVIVGPGPTLVAGTRVTHVPATVVNGDVDPRP